VVKVIKPKTIAEEVEPDWLLKKGFSEKIFMCVYVSARGGGLRWWAFMLIDVLSLTNHDKSLHQAYPNFSSGCQTGFSTCPSEHMGSCPIACREQYSCGWHVCLSRVWKLEPAKNEFIYLLKKT
jgi:hypothetical protein